MMIDLDVSRELMRTCRMGGACEARNLEACVHCIRVYPSGDRAENCELLVVWNWKIGPAHYPVVTRVHVAARRVGTHDCN